MSFNNLYNALAKKAKSRNENFTFMEGDPRKFGHGAPDPDWALMTIREGVKHGIINKNQANSMSQQFAPHAKFEHTPNGEVKVRAHSRNGKPVAAHTRSAPDSLAAASPAPTDGRTPPFAPPQHYPPLSTPKNFPEVGTPYPNAQVLYMADATASAPTSAGTDNSMDGTQVAQLGQAIGRSISNALQIGRDAAKTHAETANAIGIANEEAHNLLKSYGQNFQRELITLIEEGAEIKNGFLGHSQIKIVPDETYNPKSGNETKKSVFYRLQRINATEGITTTGKARIREQSRFR